MAHLLDLVESGTVNLAGTATSGVYIKLMEYTPQVGFEINENATVTETAQVEIRGTAAADIAAAYGSINRYFQQARTWQSAQVGTPVFVHYQPDGYAAAYRSEVIDGRVQIVEGGLNYPRWNNFRALVDVSWERRNYWETPDPVYATLTNTNGTESTIGVPMYFINDGAAVGSYTRLNYGNISANQITGDLPAPADIGIKNDSGVTLENHNFYITNSWSSLSGSLYFCEVIQCETMGSISGYLFGTTTAGTGLYSGAAARLATLVAGTTWGAVGTTAFAYPAQPNVANQSFAVFLAGRLNAYGNGTSTYNSGSDVYYRANITTGTTTIASFPWQGVEVYTGRFESFSPHLLGVAHYPTAPAGVFDMNLYLYAKRGGTVNVPIYLDYVAFVGFDSMRYLGTLSQTVSENQYVIDDPYPPKMAYITTSAPGARIQDFLAPSGELYLYPEKAQQVRVWGMRKYDEDYGAFRLSLRYRPRRLAL